ncbi:MAG: EscF/YscF/HrpA family type III secretion system needle major subunit [Alphaproteobacteria bacterium]|nr:EscF/YscF/HrpA family type III secretion system needle major subunit [Alphaproteobacteria bacterium]MDA7983266.1 EscF/YscF/HrpA family type III secretion system needle major subunit [Alphaproteobacteria bacterium]MDA7988283.1 EscF/YscF/HrpA family type III secretion system needle major subunit [Alphaproteobacteria bacterium]MDA8000471.1 EscF/YscF/HrpA family type III secretion system needle major subunit [Alphaproteobacteria bacterium]MDA8004467.1 EscF/YscF/HrpA family type III secretion sys
MSDISAATSAGAGISFDSFSKVGEQASSAMRDVQNFSTTMDPTNQGDLLKMQMLMMKASIATQLQASLTKSMDDMLKAVVQRF